MPRGNDAVAALHELADRFGAGAGNAEELIEGVRATRSHALRRAEMLPLDRAATDELYSKGLGHLKGPKGEPVISARVRGGTTIVVYETPEGRYMKAAIDADSGVVQKDVPKEALSPEKKAKLTAPKDDEK